MKLFYLPMLVFLFGCSPAQHTGMEKTEYSGVVPDQESAITAVRNFAKVEDEIRPCGEHTFEAVKVRTTTESRKTNNELGEINTVFVDEWGVDEAVANSETEKTVNRYWSVNGRSGVVKLVSSNGWSESLAHCSVSSGNA